MGRRPACGSEEGLSRKQNKSGLCIAYRCAAGFASARPLHRSDLTLSMSPCSNSDMHMQSLYSHLLQRAMVSAPKTLEDSSRQSVGKLQHGNPGRELWREEGYRLVCAGHCWVMAGHQKQRHLADRWRADVERGQGWPSSTRRLSRRQPPRLPRGLHYLMPGPCLQDLQRP